MASKSDLISGAGNGGKIEFVISKSGHQLDEDVKFVDLLLVV